MFTLHNDDCLQVMPTIPSGSIDAIITDLPYGTTACKWDTVIPFEPMWKEVKRVLKPRGVFVTTASQPFTSALIMSNPSFYSQEIIWDKVNATGVQSAKKRMMTRHENIVLFSYGGNTYNPTMVLANKNNIRPKNKGTVSHQEIAPMRSGEHKSAEDYDITKRYPSTIYTLSKFSAECNPIARKRLHRTQKPVALYEYLIKTYTNEGETVLDICMGSGTTIEAAERTGRNSIGIEKDEGIFQTAVLRLKSLTPSNNRLYLDVGDSPAQKDLFTPEAGSAAGKSPKPAPRR